MRALVKKISNPSRLSLAIVVVTTTLFAGCASTRSIPVKVQSDPLGAVVLYQVKSPIEGGPQPDWIFLGNTPLDTRREISNKNLKSADAFVLRVIKEGYIDQQKAWNGRELVEQSKEKGSVFWNPRMVPTN